MRSPLSRPLAVLALADYVLITDYKQKVRYHLYTYLDSWGIEIRDIDLGVGTCTGLAIDIHSGSRHSLRGATCFLITHAFLGDIIIPSPEASCARSTEGWPV